jgi:tetratricopeptide (TPR) repeat protein
VRGLGFRRQTFRFLRYFVADTIALFLGLLAVVTFLAPKGFGFLGVNEAFAAIFLALISTIVGLSSALTIVKLESLVGEGSEKPGKPLTLGVQSETPDALLSIVRHDFAERNYESVIRIGRALSRPLWVDGHYRERIELGKIVYQAASALGNDSAKAWTLIDDLGWTYTAENNDSFAEKNIRLGLEIAKQITPPDHYLVAKAHRHLAGIYSKRHEFQQAIRYFSKAEAEAKQIDNDKQKEEMLANIMHAKAELYYSTGNPSNIKLAENACDEAMKRFKEINDHEREIKCLSLLSKIYFEQGDFQKATDAAFRGLEVARRSSRKDAIVSNLITIGKIQMREGNVEEARRNLSTALAEADKIGLEREKIEAKGLLTQLGQKA